MSSLCIAQLITVSPPAVAIVVSVIFARNRQKSSFPSYFSLIRYVTCLVVDLCMPAGPGHERRRLGKSSLKLRQLSAIYLPLQGCMPALIAGIDLEITVLGKHHHPRRIIELVFLQAKENFMLVVSTRECRKIPSEIMQI